MSSNFKINLKVDKEFNKTMKKLMRKGLFHRSRQESLQLLNGFHDSQLNNSQFIDSFVDKNVADVTIDSNANASNKDIRSLLSEKGKSQDKLICFNKIYYEMRKEFGKKDANAWLKGEYNGSFYMHDACTSTFMPYCYAYDLSRLAKEGLFFLKNYNNVGPKHLTTFIDDVIEFISFMSNRSSGAEQPVAPLRVIS